MSIHFHHFYSNYYTDGWLCVLPLFFGFQLCHGYEHRMLMKRVYILAYSHILITYYLQGKFLRQMHTHMVASVHHHFETCESSK